MANCRWYRYGNLSHSFGRFVSVKVGEAYSRNKLALGTRLRNLNLKSRFSIFDSFRDIRVHIYDFLKFLRCDTLTQQIFAAQESLEPACLIPVLQIL